MREELIKEIEKWMSELDEGYIEDEIRYNTLESVIDIINDVCLEEE